MESRIKQLREKRGLIQEILAAELGITQQMLSKYEKDVTLIKVDILKKIAAYFNVTTDYLLGVSDVKRDLQRQMKMNETLDEFYDLVEVYKELDSYDKEMIWSIIQTIKKTSEKREKGNGPQFSLTVYPIKEVFSSRVSTRFPAWICSHANLKKAIPLLKKNRNNASTPQHILPVILSAS